MHQVLLSTHALAAVVSLGLFIARGILMFRGSAALENKVLRVAPQVADTVLLLTAVVLMVMIAQYPFVDGWLTVKLLGLIAYIVLGVIALRRGRTRQIRMAAFIGGIAVFGYLYLYSITREPLLIVGLG
ncbi:MAG: SirB2 family protein [Halorhodospira halophila]|uniref:SirB2 family protein n=1 Tax=Halorhodospira TaxID=85108 RepID=UPI0019140F34|nr:MULTISPECIES: SirB2 family protein [Halorhodospira]MBK5937088.1 hypothetical protein [Halorhodospira halophila]MBK5944697.1 hypothetical protein [Halorhodospira halophila]MCC3751114.1 SirB2 family protein [Halorhodospira halophila]MCG5527158.1 SirB2 family protein [Halorhodospira halophila]MCG5532975.1 SirB2 family protein [Halorhodospira sp. 9621]